MCFSCCCRDKMTHDKKPVAAPDEKYAVSFANKEVLPLMSPAPINSIAIYCAHSPVCSAHYLGVQLRRQSIFFNGQVEVAGVLA